MIKPSTPVRANYSLIGHESGVNCVDYYKGDKPYIVSGADDSYIIRHCNNWLIRFSSMVKIWDYQTKQCLHTLGGHLNVVTDVLFHPELPILITCIPNNSLTNVYNEWLGSEDTEVEIWNANTFKHEMTLNDRKLYTCASGIDIYWFRYGQSVENRCLERLFEYHRSGLRWRNSCDQSRQWWTGLQHEVFIKPFANINVYWSLKQAVGKLS